MTKAATNKIEFRSEEASHLINTLHPVVVPSPSPKQKESSGPLAIEVLATQLADGRIAGEHVGSRNNLMFAIQGILIRSGWNRKRIETLTKYLIVIFNEEDPDYDVDAIFEKQVATLDALYVRAGQGEDLPSYNALGKEVTQETVALVRSGLEANKQRILQEDIKEQVQKTFARLKTRILRTMTVPPIEYLCDPYLVKHGVTAFTGEAGSGKSTFVHRLLHVAANEIPGLRVIYADRDNAISYVKPRSEALSVGLEDRISYWSGGDLTDQGLIEAPWDIDSKKWIELITQIKEAGEDPVIVFDTFNSFMNGANENDNGVVGYLCSHLRRMAHAGATVLIVHHTGKSATSNEARGASAFKGAVDALWKVESEFDQTRPSMISHMVVRPKKSRLGDSVVFRFEMRDGVPTLDTAPPADAEILDFISEHEGKSKDSIINLARGRFTRELIRNAFDKFIFGKQVVIEKRKVYMGPGR